MGVHERLSTVISTKGQVILPKSIRDKRNWPSGTRLTVEETPDGILLKPSKLFAETSIDAVFGSMPHAGPALTIEDMNAAIAREAKKHAGD
jgi:AbrB family looped-hinge helix DNA binding protein